jgi:hypothetical protein
VTRSSAGPRGWTLPGDVVALLRKRWDRGDPLRRHARGESYEPVALPLRGPTAADLLDDLPAVQEWAARWAAAPRQLRVETRTVGGRRVGVNTVPARACVDDEPGLWALLGVARDVARLDAALAETRRTVPALEPWARDHAKDVLRHAEAWTRLLGVVRWMSARDGPPVYLRQVDVPGVDTKFLENHRGILASLLEATLPPDRVDREAPAGDLVRRFGFRPKPDTVRLRSLDPALPLPGGFTDLTARLDELPVAPVLADRVLVVENEVTFLALPAVPAALAVLGGGYGVTALGRLAWLRDLDVVYWGDLDTHGFAILDRARAALPHVRSLLMDMGTLLDHSEHWVREPTPVTVDLTRLTGEEHATFAALRDDHHGASVRLEQERVRFGRVERALQHWAGGRAQSGG